MAPEVLARGESLSARDIASLFDRYGRDRDPLALEALVERFLPLARHLARRYANGPEREDVEQVAAVGLVKAIERFDPDRGLEFTSFAVPTILGEVKRYFRDLGWTVRVPRTLQELAARADHANEELTAQLGHTPTAAELADRCGVSVEELLEARATTSAHRADSLDRPATEDAELTHGDLLGRDDPGFDRAEYAADVARLLTRLPERDQQIVRLRFEHDLTQHEIAERVGLSQMHVSRLLRTALMTMAEDEPTGPRLLLARR